MSQLIVDKISLKSGQTVPLTLSLARTIYIKSVGVRVAEEHELETIDTKFCVCKNCLIIVTFTSWKRNQASGNELLLFFSSFISFTNFYSFSPTNLDIIIYFVIKTVAYHTTTSVTLCIAIIILHVYK